MKTKVYSWQLPQILKTFLFVVAGILLLISVIPFLKHAYIAFSIFFLLAVMMVIASTYQKVLFYDKNNKVLFFVKQYAGRAVSTTDIKLVPDSQLKMKVKKIKGRNTMGYSENARFDTLFVTGHIEGKEDFDLIEFELFSENMDEKKEAFLVDMKAISEAIDLEMVD